MKKKLQILLVFLFLLISTALGGSSTAATTKSAAEEYPSHQIKVIVPFAAGSGVGTPAFALQKVAKKYLHQPLMVMNKPGGGGNIGLYELAKSTPDGYTWGISTPEVILHSVYGSAKHHYLTALDPIAQISSVPFLLVVNAESPWNSVEEFIQYGKSTPLKFAHGGIGSASHVIGEIIGKMNQITTLQVPFKGGSERTAMLLGKHVDAILTTPGAIKEHLHNGKLKILASTGSKRFEDPLFANVPTFKEFGMNIEFTDWYGIATSKPLPPEVKTKLVASLKEMILDPEVVSKLEEANMHVEYLGPEDSQKKWIQEAEALKRMVTETGVLEQIKQQQGVLQSKIVKEIAFAKELL